MNRTYKKTSVKLRTKVRWKQKKSIRRNEKKTSNQMVSIEVFIIYLYLLRTNISVDCISFGLFALYFRLLWAPYCIQSQHIHKKKRRMIKKIAQHSFAVSNGLSWFSHFFLFSPPIARSKFTVHLKQQSKKKI